MSEATVDTPGICIRALEQVVADHAALVGLSLAVADAMDEAAVIEALLEVAQAVCGSASAGFQSADPTLLPSATRPSTAQAQGTTETVARALAPEEGSVDCADGFGVRLVSAGDSIGCLVVGGVRCPQYQAEYLGLMSAAATLAAHAIANVRARRWLDAGEGHFRRMADRSSDVVWSTVDLPQPHLTYLSPAFESLTGLTAADLHSQPALFADIFGPSGPTRPEIGTASSRDLPVTCADGHVVVLQVTRAIVPGGAEGRARDVTAERAARDLLTERADMDPLTGLANRATLVRRLDDLLAAMQGTNQTVTVAFLDLDDFKAVNDRHGHAAGDAVLVQTARRLAGAVRVGDIVARCGGDEFVVAQARPTANRGGLGRRLTNALNRPIAVGPGVSLIVGEGFAVTCTPCIGFSETRTADVDSESLIRAADAAMYRLKAIRAVAAQASAQLTRGPYEFQHVISALPEGIVLHDSAGRVVDCNPAGEQFLGMSRDQMVAASATDTGWPVVHPDGTPFSPQEMPHHVALATATIASDVVMGVLATNGILRWLLVSAAPLEDPTGGPIRGVVSALTDITSQRRAREAESAQARQLGAAVNSLPEAVFISRPVRDKSGAVVDLLYTHVNEAAALLSGIPAEDLTGHGLLETYPFLLELGVFDAHVAVLTSGEPRTIEMPWAGGLTMSVSRAGDGVVAIVRDPGQPVGRTSAEVTEHQFINTFAITAIPTALVAIDPNHSSPGRILIANEALATFLGCLLSDLVTPPAPEVDTDAGPAALLTTLASVLLADAGARSVERRFWVRSPFPRWGVISLTAVVDTSQDQPLHLLQIQDTSEMHRMEDQLAHSTVHDSLTGMPNRVLFLDHVQQELLATRMNSHKVGLVLLDLDDFKSVNASLGHDGGDEYLMGVAGAIRDLLGEHDRAARLGGDEFVVLCGRAQNRSDVGRMAELIRSRLAEGIAVGDQVVTAAASLGIALSVRTSTPQSLLAEADSAMYVAKRLGGNRWAPALRPARRNAARVLTVEGDLRRAIESDELTLRYQPVYDLSTGRLVEVEALVRWEHPEHGLVPPSEFVPIAERRYLISALGDWVLRAAVAQAARWRDEIGPDAPVIAINASTGQLGGKGFPRTVMGELARHRLPADRISIELTETQMIAVTSRVRDELTQLQRRGIAIAVDDFGTGYAGFDYLRTLPVNILKIDKTFIDGLGRDVTDTAIAVSIIALGHGLGLTMIAEGVETELQLAELRRLGCHRGQGWLWRPALTAQDIGDLVGMDEATVRLLHSRPDDSGPCPVLPTFDLALIDPVA